MPNATKKKKRNTENKVENDYHYFRDWDYMYLGYNNKGKGLMVNSVRPVSAWASQKPLWGNNQHDFCYCLQCPGADDSSLHAWIVWSGLRFSKSCCNASDCDMQWLTWKTLHTSVPPQSTFIAYYVFLHWSKRRKKSLNVSKMWFSLRGTLCTQAYRNTFFFKYHAFNIP